MPAPDHALLTLGDVDISYDGLPAVHRLSLAARSGESVAIAGANGAGKTSLLHAIAGLKLRGQTLSGRAELEGQRLAWGDVAGRLRAGIRLVPERDKIFSLLSVEENLRIGRKGGRRTLADADVFGWFPRLAERRTSLAGNLSGGEQQMLAVAMSLLQRPRLLLLDEPTLGLASPVIESMCDSLQALRRDLGLAIIVAESDSKWLPRLADRALVIDRGREAGTFDRLDGDQLDAINDMLIGLGAATSQRPPGLPRPSVVAGIATPPKPPNAPLLRLRDVGLSFGGIRVLDGVSFTLARSEVVALIGPNGAGKSALLNCISGVYRPEVGSRILLNERPIERMSPRRIARSGLSRTFQGLNLIGDRTVLDNVVLGFTPRFTLGLVGALFRPWAFRQEEAAARRRAAETIELCGLTDVAGRPCAGLPLGVLRRVDLARALVSRPKLLLLDEPASGLSHDERPVIGEMVRLAQAQNDLAVLWIEHDLDLVFSAAERAIVLHHGVVAVEGRPGIESERRTLVESYKLGRRADVVDHAAGSNAG